MERISPDILSLVVAGLLGISAILLSIIAFFLKAWFDRVNKHLEDSEEAALDFASLKLDFSGVKVKVQEHDSNIERLESQFIEIISPMKHGCPLIEKPDKKF